MLQLGSLFATAQPVKKPADVRFGPILLQKSLMASANSDSVASTMRFAAEAGDDGAAQSRPRAAILFILS